MAPLVATMQEAQAVLMPAVRRGQHELRIALRTDEVLLDLRAEDLFAALQTHLGVRFVSATATTVRPAEPTVEDEPRRRDLGERARGLVGRNRGAVSRTTEALVPLLA